jgi:BirA family biotin operon repressor/biotin-[acetyl-CoA-carboxylase] ligase
MQDKIISFLRDKSDYISGDQISHRLGISRQALWKHIQDLRDSGYEIIAVPHLGYKLTSCPDRLFASEIQSKLQTKILGKRIYYFDVLPSTMDAAESLARQHAPEGTVVIAEAQTKGRGRRGRQWISPKYKGIYLSIILRPDTAPSASSLITILVAVALYEAISGLTGLEIELKWPNDIMFQNKKLGGILIELNAEADVVHSVVVGCGINVNSDKDSLAPSAGSLKECLKAPVDRVALLKEILRAIEKYYLLFQHGRSEQILQAWRGQSNTLGARVKIASLNQQIEGEAVDIDSDGALLIRQDSGVIKKIFSGDVLNCQSN